MFKTQCSSPWNNTYKQDIKGDNELLGDYESLKSSVKSDVQQSLGDNTCVSFVRKFDNENKYVLTFETRLHKHAVYTDEVTYKNYESSTVQVLSNTSSDDKKNENSEENKKENNCLLLSEKQTELYESFTLQLLRNMNFESEIQARKLENIDDNKNTILQTTGNSFFQTYESLAQQMPCNTIAGKKLDANCMENIIHKDARPLSEGDLEITRHKVEQNYFEISSTELKDNYNLNESEYDVIAESDKELRFSTNSSSNTTNKNETFANIISSSHYYKGNLPYFASLCHRKEVLFIIIIALLAICGVTAVIIYTQVGLDKNVTDDLNEHIILDNNNNTYTSRRLGFEVTYNYITEHFAAVRKTSVELSNKTISLEATLNYNNRFNSGKFSPLESGFCWLHASTGLLDGLTKLRLRVGNRSHVFMSESSFKSRYVMSCDLLIWVGEKESVYLESESLLFSDETGRISFLGFCPEHAMSHFAAVRVHLQHMESVKSAAPNFHKLMSVNWAVADFENGKLRLKVPKTGIYILATNLRLYKNKDNENENIGNGATISSFKIKYDKKELRITFQKYSDSCRLLSLSLIHLIQVEDHDDLIIDAVLFQIYADLYIQLMLYDPKFGKEAVWAITLDCPKNSYDSQYVVDITEKSVWDESVNASIISIPGIYYISITASVLKNYSKKQNTYVKVLRNNREPVIRLSFEIIQKITIQQSCLIKLAPNDKLYIAHVLNREALLYFSGFLIMPLR